MRGDFNQTQNMFQYHYVPSKNHPPNDKYMDHLGYWVIKIVLVVATQFLNVQFWFIVGIGGSHLLSKGYFGSWGHPSNTTQPDYNEPIEYFQNKIYDNKILTQRNCNLCLILINAILWSIKWPGHFILRWNLKIMNICIRS